MTEPPRPAGEPGSDPAAPYQPPTYSMPGEAPASGGGYTMPTSGSGYGSPAPDSGGYAAQPTSGTGGGYAPPPTSGYGTPPTSGAGGYAPPPTSGAGGYTPPPTSGAGGYAPPPAAGGFATPTSGAAYPGQPTGYPGQQQTPFGGGYPGQQQPVYPGQGYQLPPPAGYATADEKNMVLIAHWGGVAGLFVLAGLGGWIGPLIAYSSKGNESPTVRAHAVTCLNFHLTWAGANIIAWIIAGVSCFILSPLIFITWIIPVVIGIIGAVKAGNGEFYRYPASISFVK